MADIGSTLRETRMRERIDITTVESATKIRAKYLRALENEEWDQLPGPTFVRTFLRTYADYLGLDSKMLVEDYKQRYERPAAQDLMPFSTRAGGGRRPPRPPRVIPPWVLIGLAVVLLLGALFALGTLLGGEPPEDEAPVAATPTAAGPGGRGDKDRRAKPDRTPAPPKVVALQVVPEGEVYVCLENAAGDLLVPGEIISEPTATFRAARMLVTFGNGLVRMRLDGRSREVPDTDAAVGYELRPGKAPRELSADELPTCT